jgi:hypothetical protein
MKNDDEIKKRMRHINKATFAIMQTIINYSSLPSINAKSSRRLQVRQVLVIGMSLFDNKEKKKKSSQLRWKSRKKSLLLVFASKSSSGRK